MIKPYVAIDVKQPHCSRLLGVVRVADALNPFFGQATLPLRGPTLLCAQLRDFGAQGFDLGQPVQAEHFAPLARGLISGLLQ